MVTVVDRQPKVAQETSFANAGLIAPGHAASWASPRAPWMLAQSLLRRDTALRFRLRADPGAVALDPEFLANCTQSATGSIPCASCPCASTAGMPSSSCARDGHRHEIAKGALLISIAAPAISRPGSARSPCSTNTAWGWRRSIPPGPWRSSRRWPRRATSWPGDLCARRRERRLPPLHESSPISAGTMGVIFRLGHHDQAARRRGDLIASVATDDGDIAGDLYVLALGSFSRCWPAHRPQAADLSGEGLFHDPADRRGRRGADHRRRREFHLVAFARLGGC